MILLPEVSVITSFTLTLSPSGNTLLLAFEPAKEIIIVDLEREKASKCDSLIGKHIGFEFMDEENILVESLLDIKMYKLVGTTLQQTVSFNMLGRQHSVRSVFDISATRLLSLNTAGIYSCLLGKNVFESVCPFEF